MSKHILSNPKASKWYKFKKDKKGYYSFIIFIILFTITLLAEFIANDKPLILYYKNKLHFPTIQMITEEDLGGDYVTAADFNDPFVIDLVSKHGWMVMPPIHFNQQTINYYLPGPAPSPPTLINYLGTDDQGRDILARLIYGFRLTIVFSIALTVLSSVIGIALGAIQGYYGGSIDLFLQRFIEVWSELPMLYILIIISSFITPSVMGLLGILLFFSWVSLVGLVRAEFLKARNLEYVMAAKALGVGELQIIIKHILPNAFVACFTFIPFILSSVITTLTALDFLGLGLPPGSSSLGEVVAQAKNNLHAYWISSSAFITLVLLLSLLIFTGESIRNVFDPRSNK